MIMKKILLALFLLISFASVAQYRPTGNPAVTTNARYKIGFVQADSGFIWGIRDTFPAAYRTTIWHSNGNFYKTEGGTGSHWSLWVGATTPSTLNQVLTAGNTSLLDAKIGTLFLYDVTNTGYGSISINNNVFSGKKIDGNDILHVDDAAFKWGQPSVSSTINSATNTADRIWRMPDSSGTVALLSNITGGNNYANFYLKDSSLSGDRRVSGSGSYGLHLDSLTSHQISANNFYYSNIGTSLDVITATSQGMFFIQGDPNGDQSVSATTFRIDEKGQIAIKSTNADVDSFIVRALLINGNADTARWDYRKTYFNVNNTYIKSLNAQTQNGDNANSFIAESNDGKTPSIDLFKSDGRTDLKHVSLQQYGNSFLIMPQDDTYGNTTSIFESILSAASGVSAHQTFISTIDSGGTNKTSRLQLDAVRGFGIETSSSGSQNAVSFLRNDSLPNATSQPLQLPNATGKMLLAGVKVNGTTYYGIANGVADLGTISSGGLANSNFVTNEEFTGSTSSTYTLANTPVTASLDVYKNGVKLQSSEFSVTGTTVTLTSARVSGDIISNSYRK